ncbi:MAG: HRDC domain-containing protein, partial [Bacteroidia bacterium]|nr:HRDC domain-containing protein [Bacteroidia bacterium]
GKPVAEQEIGKQLLAETVTFAESSVCRRKTLLHYFGEEYNEDNCGNCDNCLHPKEEFEGKDDIALMLKVIKEVNEKFAAPHIVNVLIGHDDQHVSNYHHNELEIFGEGDDYEGKHWMAAIRQATIHGLLQKDIENYGLLSLTDAGKKFLKKPTSIMLTKDHDYRDIEGDDGGGEMKGGTASLDEELYSMLRDLRKKVAKQKNLPPFIIFQDPSLEEMSSQYPINMDELKTIVGVGTGKAMKYGKPFIELISKYVEENEIDRPSDLVVKSLVNKSSLKVYIIQNVDRKRSLDDIADTKKLTLAQLVTEIESIVNSGTKLDLNYYINDIVDEERQEEIFDYYREAETDSIEDCLAELGEEYYSKEDIQLVRIKFYSELGN